MSVTNLQMLIYNALYFINKNKDFKSTVQLPNI